MSTRERVEVSMADYHWHSVQYGLGKALEAEDVNKYHRQKVLFAIRHIQRAILEAENKKHDN